MESSLGVHSVSHFKRKSATMKKHVSILSLALIIAGMPATAQDGEQLYGLYCGACHGADGKGAANGTFPPLAGSEWVVGNPKRTIAIVLKGLHGPVEVAGKSFNLEMPPQQDALSVENIASILNYVHKAWGNKGQDVKNDMIKVTKAEFASRNKHWTAEEILGLYPLEKKIVFLDNLTSRVYKGDWQKLPDFSALKAENVEEEHSGVLDVSLAELKDKFGIVWEGDFRAPKAGEYEFIVFGDDAARVIFGTKKVCEIDGIGPVSDDRSSRGTVTLKAGANPIRVEYMQNAGLQSISVGWREKGSSGWSWISADRPSAEDGADPIVLKPTDGKTAIYRNFIKGVSARAIGFGFPGQVNLAYSADHLGPELVWAGEFIDASRHWTNRGNGFQPPMSKKPHKLTTTRLFPAAAKFRGYTLDKVGNPTFHIQFNEMKIKDEWKPGKGKSLVRTMTMTGGAGPLEISLGDSTITQPAGKVSLAAGKPTEIIYQLD
jgi:mono/diheme cytochrome c family protein